MKITKIVIDENRWLRAGRGGGLVSDNDLDKLDPSNYPKDKAAKSTLLDPKTSRMCCLGFASCSAGVSKKDIKNISAPSGIKQKAKQKVRTKFPWLIDGNGRNTKAASDLMIINDDSRIPLPEKRSKIKKIFADNGVDVIFTR
jgi:hypothetical protein